MGGPLIRIPNNWAPRAYQLPLWRALETGTRRAVAIWHRRAGKDDVCLHWTARAAMQLPGTYWHMLPEASQARKAIWDAVNPHTGKRRIDEAFPLAIREATRDHDMFIRFTNGSTWQVIGSDNFESLLGAPPRGLVFSEYALANPNAWAMLRPILAENDGWALWISTPRGRNHLYRLYEYARTDPTWFAELLTVTNTGAISPERIEQERRELIAERGSIEEAEAIIAQEYFCSWTASLPGTYYATIMAHLDEQGSIDRYPYNPQKRVGTAWDLGIGDSTAIWFYQELGSSIVFIDCLEGSGVGLDWYAKQLAARPYAYYDHILPHDAGVHDLGTGLTRVRTLADLGIRGRVMDRGTGTAGTGIDDGIQAVRSLLPRCLFNTQPVCVLGESKEQAKERMGRGIDALRNYRRIWDDKLRRFRDAPHHDYCSHYADAMRYCAQGYRSPVNDADFTRIPANWRA